MNIFIMRTPMIQCSPCLVPCGAMAEAWQKVVNTYLALPWAQKITIHTRNLVCALVNQGKDAEDCCVKGLTE